MSGMTQRTYFKLTRKTHQNVRLKHKLKIIPLQLRYIIKYTNGCAHWRRDGVSKIPTCCCSVGVVIARTSSLRTCCPSGPEPVKRVRVIVVDVYIATQARLLKVTV